MDQLSQYAHRGERNTGTVPETGGLRTPQGHRHRKRQPYSFILNEHPISILSIPGAKECCIEFNSMSKSHNMPGWRIGMLASNADFVQWILKVKSNIDSGMFRAMQLAAATALEAEQDWYDGNNANYRNAVSWQEKSCIPWVAPTTKTR